LAVCLDLALTLFKCTPYTAFDRCTTDWQKITTDRATNDRYNDPLLAAATNADMPYKEFHGAIVKTGVETALAVQSKNDDWFLFNQDHLAPPIDEGNQLIHALHNSADLPSFIVNATSQEGIVDLQKFIFDAQYVLYLQTVYFISQLYIVLQPNLVDLTKIYF
jgi:hypothetical protein